VLYYVDGTNPAPSVVECGERMGGGPLFSGAYVSPQFIK